MAEVSRDEVLSIFKEITKIEDIQICNDILEYHHWNLEEAVQSAIPPDVCSLSADIVPYDNSTNITATTTTTSTSTAHTNIEASLSIPSSSSSSLFESDELRTNLFSPLFDNNKKSPHMLKFNVEYKNKTVPLQILSTETVVTIKEQLAKRLDIPVSYQELKGWPLSSKVEDWKMLKDLNLSKETKLQLHSTQTKSSPTLAKPKHTNMTAESSSKSCSSLFDAKPNENSNQKEKGMEVDDDDEDVDHIDDYDDDDLMNDEIWNVSQPKFGPLMPEEFTDERIALEQFTHGFIDRFGECHPEFYIGSLDDAIKDSLMLRAKERKPLAVYLHDDKSILTNVFCSKVLCSEEIVSYLTENFFVWAWDMTNDKNKERLLSMATRHFGNVAATQIKSYIPNQLPLLLIISRARSTNEVSTVIQGSTNLDELMSNLISAFELFQDQQRQDIVEEDERERRELIKQEQDEAYEASLVADRLKDECRQKEIEVEKLAQKKKQEDEQVRLEKEKCKKQIRETLAKELPDEPSEDSQEEVTQIRLHMPTGNIVTRRFLGREPLRYLLYFIMSKGFPTEEFKVLSRYPQQDITLLDQNRSFKQLKLFPQVTLFVAER